MPHRHSEESKRAVVNRLSRAMGHLAHVKTMVEDDVDCADVLIQLSAVKSAIASTEKVILKGHIEHCLVHAVEEHDQQTLEDLKSAIDKIL